MDHTDWIALAQWLVPMVLSFFTGKHVGKNRKGASRSTDKVGS